MYFRQHVKVVFSLVFAALFISGVAVFAADQSKTPSQTESTDQTKLPVGTKNTDASTSETKASVSQSSDDKTVTPSKDLTKAENKAEDKTQNKAKSDQDSKKKAGQAKKEIKAMYAVFEIEQDGNSLGKFKAKLFHKQAPNTVDNFVGLAEGTKEFIDIETKKYVKRPFYDGVIFHRVIPGFMIQGGDPTGTGRGGPGYKFDDEPHPELKHSKEGMLSMANAGPNTNGSQFFVTVAPTPHLDFRGTGKEQRGHTVFGEVVDGMELVKKISTVPTGPGDRPAQPVVIKKLIIERE